MKSHERNQYELARRVYTDAVARCVAVQPALRDLCTIKSRIEDEGLSFLTITLPAFCKDFERSLADGVIDSTAFRSFKKVGAIPAFLQGMLSRVFDRETGRIINEENLDVSCVGAIRQIANCFKKLETDCSPKRVAAALGSFVAIERDLSMSQIPEEEISEFLEVSTCLWFDLRNIDYASLVPKHGPGAVAENIRGNSKYSWQRWHSRLEPYFPLLDTAYVLSAYGSKEFEEVTIVTEEQEQPVRVVTVPKTMKGPRIIAIEPCCMQYAQQSIKEQLYTFLEDYYLTRGHVNFTDQSINRSIAIKASQDHSMATLDLSEASDRVYGHLAINMFNSNPDLQGAIKACRSRYAEMPDGTKVGPLVKFASMGSALCFPIESMYFYTICVMARLRLHNLPVTSKNIFIVSRDVYVYGDDIIVPTDEATTIADYLQKYHCKVNMSKSFWSGNFRESCGMDAYSGTEVTPTYIRKLHPRNRRQASEIVSWVKTAQLFEEKGYVETAEYMFNTCQRILGIFPDVPKDNPGLGRIRSCVSGRTRYNQKLQRQEVMAWVAAPAYHDDMLDGYGALTKCLLLMGRRDRECNILEPSPIDIRHLERSARHGVVTLKRRWVAAH